MTNDSSSSTGLAPHQTRLQGLRESLLSLHKTLMDSEKASYEAVFGPIASSNQFLQLMLRDPWFAWLRAISEMIVQMDEALDGKEPLTVPQANRFADQVRELFKPTEGEAGFSKNYHEALQRDPDVVLAHAEVVKALKS